MNHLYWILPTLAVLIPGCAATPTEAQMARRKIGGVFAWHAADAVEDVTFECPEALAACDAVAKAAMILAPALRAVGDVLNNGQDPAALGLCLTEDIAEFMNALFDATSAGAFLDALPINVMSLLDAVLRHLGDCDRS